MIKRVKNTGKKLKKVVIYYTDYSYSDYLAKEEVDRCDHVLHNRAIWVTHDGVELIKLYNNFYKFNYDKEKKTYWVDADDHNQYEPNPTSEEAAKINEEQKLVERFHSLFSLEEQKTIVRNMPRF